MRFDPEPSPFFVVLVTVAVCIFSVVGILRAFPLW